MLVEEHIPQRRDLEKQSTIPLKNYFYWHSTKRITCLPVLVFLDLWWHVDMKSSGAINNIAHVSLVDLRLDDDFSFFLQPPLVSKSVKSRYNFCINFYRYTFEYMTRGNGFPQIIKFYFWDLSA